MKNINVETGVGLFMVFGFICLGYLSITLGGLNFMGTDRYVVEARFASTAGLKEGATVEIAGVSVGEVDKIELDDYESAVRLLIDPEIKLQEDSIASIRTQGIIGDKYIKISPGGAEEFIEVGGEIIETESAIDIEELIGKYIFDKE